MDDHNTEDEYVACELIYPGGADSPRAYQLLGHQVTIVLPRSFLDTLDPRRNTIPVVAAEIVEQLPPPEPEPRIPTPPKKTPIPQRLRKKILERDGYRCQECGDWHNLAIDHIYPESKGGTQEESNLRALCRTCNVRKRDKV